MFEMDVNLVFSLLMVLRFEISRVILSSRVVMLSVMMIGLICNCMMMSLLMRFISV